MMKSGYFSQNDIDNINAAMPEVFDLDEDGISTLWFQIELMIF